VGTLLLITGIGVGFIPDWRCGVAVVVYAIFKVCYSTVLKHQPVLDLLAVEGGFVMMASGEKVCSASPRLSA
jgi:decaprenyl-phosphate phosphoribosyltransferase